MCHGEKPEAPQERRAPNLRNLSAYSVASGVPGLAFLLLMVANAEPGAATRTPRSRTPPTLSRRR